jgi:hypothetical protein
LERRDLLAAPTLQINTGFSLVTGGTFTITNGQLLTTDPDTPANQLVYSLQSVPANGALQLTGINMAVGNNFTQQDINNNSLRYIHNGSASTADTFDFVVSDGSLLNSTTRVSLAVDGSQGSGDSFTPTVSGDGRLVAFATRANDLFAGDTNIFSDIYVKNRQTGAVELISKSSSGTISNSSSVNPTISADGRYVAFLSFASNLVPNDVSSFLDIFVHDRQTGTTERVNVDATGTEANQGQSQFHVAAISSDGRYVAFVSSASNLVAGDTNNAADVFVKDRQTGAVRRVSVTSGGFEVSSGAAFFENPAISGDGRYVAFISNANDLVPNDNNIFMDVFVHDTLTGQTSLVSVGSDGVSGGNSFYSDVSISADGRYVAFVSNSSTLVAGDTNSANDVFVKDLVTGQVTRVSVNSNGVQGNAGSGDDRPQISADGRYVLFDSVATNLVGSDTNGVSDLFLRDLQIGETTRVTLDSFSKQVNPAYGPGAIPNQNATLSADGRVAVFASASSNLVTNDTNGRTDIFARDSGIISASVPITITEPGNTPPAISAIANQITNEDTPTNPIAFTINDAETPADSLIVSAESSNTVLIPSNGFLFGGNGNNRTLTITPAANLNGTTIITVRVIDGRGASATSTFTLTVNPVNDPPVLANIGPRALNEGDLLRFVASATDPDGNQLFYTIDNPPTGAVIGLNSGVFTWTPNSTQAGVYNITVRVTDNGNPSLTDFEVVTVTVNDPPTITDLGNRTTPEDTPLGPIDFSVSDLETPVNNLFVLGSSSNQSLIPNGNIAITGAGSNRQVTITPVANQSGTATITLRVFDGSTSTTDTFDVTVTPVNDSPTISVIADQAVDEDTTRVVSFTIGDVETPAGSLVVSATSDSPVVIPNANLVLGGSGTARTLTITPSANLSGTTVGITVQVSDGMTTTTRTFNVFVNPVNDPPTITAISDQSTFDNTPTVAVSFDVGDIESDPATLLLNAITTNPTLVPLGNIVFGGAGVTRTVTVTPAPNQVGSAVINVLVTDPQGGLALESFVLNVNFQNDSPTITDIPDQTVNQYSSLGPIAFSVGDQETAAASLTVSVSITNTSNLARPTAIVTSSGGGSRNLTLVPPTNVTGVYDVAVTVADANGGIATDTFRMTVQPTAGSLSITDLPDFTILEDAQLGPIEFQVVNTAAPGTFTLSTTSSNPTLVPIQNVTFGSSTNPAIPALSTITIRPAADQSGIADITVTAVGTNNETVSTTFRLTVQSVLDLTRFRRAYNPNADFHFFTTSLNEFNSAIVAGYRDETTFNSGFSVAAEAVAGSLPVYRLYNLQKGFHYYTTSSAERDFLTGLVPPNSPDFGRIGWRYERDEGFMYTSPAVSTVEISRLYNPATGAHLFTESPAVRNGVLALGTWVQHRSLGFAYPIVVGVSNPPVILSARSGKGAVAAAQSTVLEPAPITTGETVASPLATPNELGGRLFIDRPMSSTSSTPRSAAVRNGDAGREVRSATTNPAADSGSLSNSDLDSLWMRFGPALMDEIDRVWN